MVALVARVERALHSDIPSAFEAYVLAAALPLLHRDPRDQLRGYSSGRSRPSSQNGRRQI